MHQPKFEINTLVKLRITKFQYVLITDIHIVIDANGSSIEYVGRIYDEKPSIELTESGEFNRKLQTNHRLDKFNEIELEKI